MLPTYNTVIEILRMETGDEHGTIGKMRINKSVFADTMEPADRLNKRNISSIPTGQYICQRIKSPKYGETFEICDITDRDNVLFHWGNFDDDTQGCVLLGNGIGVINKRRAVLSSKNTFRDFMRRLDHVDSFHLTIAEHY